MSKTASSEPLKSAPPRPSVSEAPPDAPPAPPHPPVGSLINEKYKVEEVIGEGAVGIVLAAQNVELGERVALKFLKASMLKRADVVARFMHEAKAACSIKTEHSATVFDVGRTAEGYPFLVMEFLEGRDLASVIAEGEPLSVRDVAEFGMQVCDALAVAHAKGIIHRDIKPENLFLDSRSGMPSLKVLDFGISKTALTGTVLSTMLPLMDTSQMTGTPLYMSPEQVRSSDTVDARTDIWSLGIVMFEALTGRFPFHAETITELCTAILDNPLEPITRFRDGLPEGFVAVLDRCLEKDVDKRYQSVAELAVALMPFAPKRARICAERAAHVLISAGLVAPDAVRFPSAAPPALSELPGAVAPSPSSASALAVSREVSPETSGPASGKGPPSGKTRGGAGRLVAVGAALVILLGLGLVLQKRWSAPADEGAPNAAANAAKTVEALPSAPSTPPPEATAAPPPDPVAASADSAAAPSESEGPSGLVAAAPSPRGAAPRAARPAPPPRVAPKPQPPPPPQQPPTAAPKKPDPTDIGY